MYMMDGQTDRQTDGQKQSLLPPSLWAGHNNMQLADSSSNTNKIMTLEFGAI